MWHNVEKPWVFVTSLADLPLLFDCTQKKTCSQTLLRFFLFCRSKWKIITFTRPGCNAFHSLVCAWKALPKDLLMIDSLFPLLLLKFYICFHCRNASGEKVLIMWPSDAFVDWIFVFWRDLEKNQCASSTDRSLMQSPLFKLHLSGSNVRVPSRQSFASPMPCGKLRQAFLTVFS